MCWGTVCCTNQLELHQELLYIFGHTKITYDYKVALWIIKTQFTGQSRLEYYDLQAASVEAEALFTSSSWSLQSVACCSITSVVIKSKRHIKINQQYTSLTKQSANLQTTQWQLLVRPFKISCLWGHKQRTCPRDVMCFFTWTCRHLSFIYRQQVTCI